VTVAGEPAGHDVMNGADSSDFGSAYREEELKAFRSYEETKFPALLRGVEISGVAQNDIPASMRLFDEKRIQS